MRSPKQATLVLKTTSKKLGMVSATHASQGSCPKSCPLYRNGCYAELGFEGVTARHWLAQDSDPMQVAEREADLILDAISKGKDNLPLRLHVVGDCPTDFCAITVSEAAEQWSKPVWTYTHAHNVDRGSWGEISVLRSCESIDQVKKAHRDGYAAALIVKEFKSDTAYELEPGLIGIPCPEMTGRAKDCASCRLCWHDNKLRQASRVILFAAHGAAKEKVRSALA